ncbi:hypothetical protein SDC9_67770 [bioreactor metagenome]|uniref:Uncharacterized protein n=1 Tax=bioreactor metagenome TaxID=1076179 RepID=A0A644XYI9_9ZZZZ|nr:hypothetical protein [Candidatus Metalachnospira sp.]
MYPYHNKIKQRINDGELIDFYFTENRKGIGECLVLVFDTEPRERPIRPYRYCEYSNILADCKREKKELEIIHAGRTII